MDEQAADRRAGQEVRKLWAHYLAEAARGQAGREKLIGKAKKPAGFRSLRSDRTYEEYYLWEFYNRSYLAKDQVLFANGIGEAGKEGLTGLTWKEAAESVYRCLKVMREPADCQDVLRRPKVGEMRRFLVRASMRQALMCEFDDAVATANFFLEVRSEQVCVEEVEALMVRGIARFYQGLPASVKDFGDAAALAAALQAKELEAHAWFAKGYALYFVDPLDYVKDYFQCFEKCLEILEGMNESGARVKSVRDVVASIEDRVRLNWGPRCEWPVGEIKRLKEAEESQSREEHGYPGALAGTKQALGSFLFHNNMLIEAEEKFREAVVLWNKANRMKKDSMYQVTAALSITGAFNQLQACLVKQEKPLEALMWSERARARVLRNRVEHEDECRLFEEDDNVAQEKIKTVLDGYTGSVVAIEYSFVSTTLLIWVLKPKSSPTVKQVPLDTLDFPAIGARRVEEGRRTSLTIMQLVDVLLQSIRSAKSDQTCKGYLEFFYKLLIEPVKDELTGCDTIIFIPVQALNRLPWAALRDLDGQYLGQQYAVLKAHSLYMLGICFQQWEKKRATTFSHGDDILMVSNPWPLSNPNLSRLKFAEAETSQIRKLVETHTGVMPAELKGKEATREKVMKRLPRAKWVHMASHNICDIFYGAGALMLSAPKATVYDWSRPADVTDVKLAGNCIDLQSMSARILRTRTDYASFVGHAMDAEASEEETRRGVLSARQLTSIPTQACGVVLSGCSTASGELVGDEGILGLARALHVAGTPAVMEALWDVSDKHTSTLMTQLYKNLVEEGVPWEWALKRAREHMMRAGQVQVRDWAAFQINGTPGITFPRFQPTTAQESAPITALAMAVALLFAAIALFWALVFRF